MKALILGLACLAIAACDRTEPPARQASGRVRFAATDVVGYRHGLDRTRFDVGGGRATRSRPGQAQTLGSLGAFSVNLENGASDGVSTAKRIASLEAEAPQVMEPDRHADTVLRYFLSAGLPQDQIAGVDTLTLLREDGRVGETPRRQPKVTGYVSVLRRQVGGIPVPESYAWAQIDPRGRVIQEAVFWPPLPDAALQAARRLAPRATDRALLEKLSNTPAPAAAASAALHHSLATQPGAVRSVATLDVAVPGETSLGDARVVHVDEAGARISVPSESQPERTEAVRR